jgi:ubiquinone/menaquinone biosynthesis C-methylase UbiE
MPGDLPVGPEVAAYYEAGHEAARLSQTTGQIEFARTQAIIMRYLPSTPATIVDIGGGPGAYALWLAALGHHVHLLDAMPLHIEQALAASKAQPSTPLTSATVGDARQLPFADASADMALLLGPLYHLTERTDRLAAWREAARVVRPGGVIVAATISRFASFFDGMKRGLLDEPMFFAIAQQDLIDGQHRNPTSQPTYFTTTYFHHPGELAVEITEAGLEHVATLAVEGPMWLFPWAYEHWDDPAHRATMLTLLQSIEADPTLLGASSHVLGIGRVQAAATP